MRFKSQSGASAGSSHTQCYWARLARFPAAIRQRLVSPWRLCSLRITGSDAILVGPRKRDAIVSFDLGEGTSAVDDQRRTLAHRWLSKSTICNLQLRISEFLVREVKIPASAKAKLQDILDLNLQRVIPADIIDFTYGYRVVGREGAQLNVQQLVLRKDRLEQILDFAAQLHFPIDCIELVGSGDTQGSHLNLRDAPRLRRKRSLWPANAALIIVVLAMILAALQLNLRQQRIELAAIDEQTAARLASAVALKQEIAGLEQQLARQAALAALWAKARSNIALLDDVTKRLPDTAWIIEYRAGDTLQLTGFAKSAGEVLDKLEASKMLQGAKFTAPIQVDPLQKAERFVLTAQVAP